METPPPPAAAVTAQARANFYGLTRESEPQDEKVDIVVDDISPQLVDTVPDARPGNQTEDVYETVMAPWRFALRRTVMTNLQRESEWIGAMQERMRSPWWDEYFVYSSTLGTHTFFLIFLPAIFFFGFDEHGRGLLYMTTSGVYVSSFIKDLICSPRPFAPPVTRLTIGTHHLEYGFLSTHSANCVSLALYCHSYLYQYWQNDAVSNASYVLGVIGLLWYIFSIVFGRLYTGMHSITDVTTGSALGAAIWWLHMTFGEPVDHWITANGWQVPVIVTALAVVMINQHPQPIDDCPCFEDAIACIAVLAGCMTGRWYAFREGLTAESDFYVHRTPGWRLETWQDKSIWLSISAAKLICGVLVIAIWRVAVKFIMHTILPPIFRSLAQIATLPNRRFYIPATDYSKVPVEKSLQPFPSVIDLPGTLHAHSMSTVNLKLNVTKVQKRRFASSGGSSRGEEEEKHGGHIISWDGGEEVQDEHVKHYDADVLTKAIVYAGIGIIATQATPIVFELLGIGVN